MNASSVKAAIYVRQSKDSEEGIERGLIAARELVEDNGWTLFGEYADNATSASRERKKDTDWHRLLEDIRAGKVNAVVGIDMDRLLRRVVDVLTLIDLKVTIVTLDGELNTTTAEGRRRAVDQANGAQFEAERKGERQRRANVRDRRDKGIPVPGKRRFGFLAGEPKTGNKEKDDARRLVNTKAHPEEAALVRWAFQAVIQKRSTYSIAAELGLGVDTVNGILRNPAYAGWITEGDYDTKGRRVQFRTIEAHPSVDRIVSEATWKAAQAILDTKVKTSPGNKIVHLLSGLMVCVVCEGPIRYNAKGYRCKVGHVYLDEEIAEREVIEELLYVLREPEGAAAAEAPELTALNLQEAELKRQRTVAQTIGMMPDADLEHLSRELARISKDLGRVAAEQKALRLSQAKADLATAVFSAWEFDGWEQDALDQWVSYFRGLPLDQQRELIRDNLTIRLDRGRVVESLTVDALR